MAPAGISGKILKRHFPRALCPQNYGVQGALFGFLYYSDGSLKNKNKTIQLYVISENNLAPLLGSLQRLKECPVLCFRNPAKSIVAVDIRLAPTKLTLSMPDHSHIEFLPECHVRNPKSRIQKSFCPKRWRHRLIY